MEEDLVSRDLFKVGKSAIDLCASVERIQRGLFLPFWNHVARVVLPVKIRGFPSKFIAAEPNNTTTGHPVYLIEGCSLVAVFLLKARDHQRHSQYTCPIAGQTQHGFRVKFDPVGGFLTYHSDDPRFAEKHIVLCIFPQNYWQSGDVVSEMRRSGINSASSPNWDDFSAVQARLHRLQAEVVPSLKYWLFQPHQLTHAIPTLLTSRILVEIEKADDSIARSANWGVFKAMANNFIKDSLNSSSLSDSSDNVENFNSNGDSKLPSLQKITGHYNAMCQNIFEDYKEKCK